MNFDRLLMWAEELETTQEKQGKGRLVNREGEYCCLGIAELVRAREVGCAPVLHAVDGVRLGLPTRETDEWYGTALCSLLLPFGVSSMEHMEPATANDKEDKSFKQIAAAIRVFVDRERLRQQL